MKKITLLLALFLAFATKSYAQFPQGFEDATFPPAGWASFIGANGLGTAQNWQRTTTYVAEGTAAAFVRYDNAAPGSIKEDWLVTPQFTVSADAPALSFMHSQDYDPDWGTTYSIRISTTSQTSHAAFTTILEMSEEDVPLEYGARLVDLSAYVGQQIYVAFVMANDDGDNWYIDDVNMVALSSAPQCASGPSPADMAVDVPVGTVTFSWEAPTTGDAPISYDLYAGDAPGAVDTFIANVETTTIDLNILAYNTLIYWKIVPKNAAGSATGCAEWSFTTQASPGYCLNAPYGQYPGGVAGYTPENCDGVEINEITTAGYAGEYSLVNVVEGQSYTFMSGTSDFVTIAAATGNTAYAYGETPVTWVSTLTGQVRFFSHLDDQCGTEAESRVRAVVCGTPTADLPDYVNLQFPSAIEITEGETDTVYGQVYEAGLTDVEPGLTGQAEGITMWVGVSTENTDPATWSPESWILADFNAASISNNDEYMAVIGGGLDPGTYYYATRFRLNEGAYVYGGTDGTNGNFWDGTTFNSGVMTISAAPAPTNDECSGAISLTPANNFAAAAITTTNIGATSDNLEPSCQAVAGENVWYSVVVPASGNITLETGPVEGSLYNDSVMAVYSGTCGALTELGCSDDDTEEGLFSLVSLTSQTPGSVLYVSVWRYNSEFASGEPGQFQVSAYDASLATQSFDNNGFSFYPNPVKDKLNLSYSDKISQVEIFNLIGQQLMSAQQDTTEVSLDMSHLSAGAYLVKITSDGVSKTIKVVKQ